MNELTQEQMDMRFRNRRKVALASFILMSAVILSLLGIGLFSEEARKGINDMRWLLTTATGLWTTLVLGYYISASYEQGRAS